MQAINKYKGILSAIVGSLAIGNGGYVLSSALNAEHTNIMVLAQAILFLLFGGGGVFYGAKNTTAKESPAFADDIEAVQHLSKSCGSCPESQKALITIATNLTKGLFQNE